MSTPGQVTFSRRIVVSPAYPSKPRPSFITRCAYVRTPSGSFFFGSGGPEALENCKVILAALESPVGFGFTATNKWG